MAIADAKRPETRARRIDTTLAMLTGGTRAVRVAPSDKPVAARMHVKPGASVVVLEAPAGISFGVPTTSRLTGRPDVVVLFAPDCKRLAARIGKVAKAITKDGPALWIAYPKTSSPLASDLSRDHGWEPVLALGLRPVTQVAVDETWSALRFRP